jgi:hypothetical protein
LALECRAHNTVSVISFSNYLRSDPRFDWDNYCTAFLTLPATTSVKSVVKTNTVTGTIGGTTTIGKVATTTP